MSNQNNEIIEKNSQENIEKRLDTIISLLMNNTILQETLTQKMVYLTKMSFSNDEIAKILTTKKSVEAQKYKKSKRMKNEK